MSMRVQVRYFAAAKAAVGVSEESVSLEEGASVGDLVAAVLARTAVARGEAVTAPGADPAAVFSRCSYLLDGEPVETCAPLSDGARLDVLPPFAGG